MGSETAILVVASDLEEEAPLWWLRVKQAADRGARLIVANPRPTKTDRYAAQVLRYAYGSEAAALGSLLEHALQEASAQRGAAAQEGSGCPTSLERLRRAPAPGFGPLAGWC
jgi:NADH-quinone oxidoreductase subunit G